MLEITRRDLKEKCSVCPWTGEDAEFSEKKITMNLIGKGLKRYAGGAVSYGICGRYETFLCCPRCGGIVMSEFTRDSKAKR